MGKREGINARLLLRHDGAELAEMGLANLVQLQKRVAAVIARRRAAGDRPDGKSADAGVCVHG